MYTGTLNTFETWVLDKWSEPNDDATTRQKLEELYCHGWDSYGIGYGEAARVMDNNSDYIWSDLGELADDQGTTVLALIDQRHHPTSHHSYMECAFGMAAEWVARRLADSEEWTGLT